MRVTAEIRRIGGCYPLIESALSRAELRWVKSFSGDEPRHVKTRVIQSRQSGERRRIAGNQVKGLSHRQFEVFDDVDQTSDYVVDRHEIETCIRRRRQHSNPSVTDKPQEGVDVFKPSNG